MSDPYVRFSELKFDNRQCKNFCKLLYKQIKELEENLMAEEECYEFLINISDQAAKISNKAIENHKKILFAMKLTFWYYTGVNVSCILDEDKHVDIFSLV